MRKTLQIDKFRVALNKFTIEEYMTKRIFKDHTCKAEGCNNIAAKDKYGLYKSYCSDKCNPRKQPRICNAPGCNNVQPKNKYGNYVQYCSDECRSKSVKQQFKEVYDNKTEDEKLAILEKRRETTQELYGVDNVSKAQSVKDTIRETMNERYDGWYSSTDEGKKAIADAYNNKTDKQKQSIINARIKTNKLLFDNDYAMQNHTVAGKASQTLQAKAPEEWAEIRKLKNETCLELYGNKNYNNRPKYIKTCVSVFGVSNPAQNAIIHAKQFNNGYKSKPYIFPSGKTVMIQGYELFALNELLESYNEIDIVTEKISMPEFWYEELGKRRYYPDIYIQKDNLIVEVKSEYTYAGTESILATNLLKMQSCIDAGYRYRLMMYDKNGKKIRDESR